MSITLQTTHGDMRIKLHWTLAPLECRNFLELCKAGYYDGNFVYQFVPGKYLVSGAPDPKHGNFGRSIYGPNGFKSEMTAKLAHTRAGVVGCWVAENRLNENGSQFYVTFSPQEDFDGKLVIFGQVENLDILAQLSKSDKTDKSHIPTQPFKIFGSLVTSDPWAGQALPVGAEIPEKVLVKEGNPCQLM